MNNQELRKLLKKLQVIMRCPNCGKRYIPEEIAMRGYLDQTYFLHLDCSNCHIPVFATIAISGDLKKEIVGRAKKSSFIINKGLSNLREKKVSEISDSDIKEFSESIDQFDGSFSENL